MDVRRQFVRDYAADVWSMTELCAQYGVARKTGYKWVARFEAEGRPGLEERSRRPHQIAHAVPDAVREALCAARRARPTWGARKQRDALTRDQPQVPWPSRTTIHAVWHAAGLIPAPGPVVTRAARPSPVRTPATAPNEVWTADFKGDFRLGDGQRCYPLTIRDLYSRYSLRCDGVARPDGPATAARFRRAFAAYGLPVCIRTDNGEPFAGGGLAGLSQLNVEWLRWGIRVERIAPGRPDQNGAHEQFHRVLKAEAARPPAASLAAQQRRLHAFQRDYNHARPHAALGGDRPAAHYQPSPRRWSPRLPPLDYAGHWTPCRVTTNGRIRFGGHAIFLSRALAGQTVALDECEDGIWTVYFATVCLARWDARTQVLSPVR